VASHVFSIGRVYSNKLCLSSYHVRAHDRKLPTEEKHSRGSGEIAAKLIEVEVLYGFAPKPFTISELSNRLQTSFGLETDRTSLEETVDNLVSDGLLRNFSNYSADPEKFFSITPDGLSKLGEWIESLSEITLMMQLGLHQRIAMTDS